MVFFVNELMSDLIVFYNESFFAERDCDERIAFTYAIEFWMINNNIPLTPENFEKICDQLHEHGDKLKQAGWEHVKGCIPY